MLIRNLIAELESLAEIHAQANEPDVVIEAPRGMSRVVNVRKIADGPDGIPRVSISYVDPPPHRCRR